MDHCLGAFRRQVDRVATRLRESGHQPEPDQIAAGPSLDNWRFLLIRCLEATIWKALIDLDNGGMPHSPGRSRARFGANVDLIRCVRNRASHQEPLISVNDDADVQRLCNNLAAIDQVAGAIDPRAAAWIATSSRIPALLALRPRAS